MWRDKGATLNISSLFFIFVEARINLGFLIDGSDSVGEQNFRISLDFMKNVYGAFWTQFGSLHLGLVVFGTETRLIFDFDNQYTDKTELNNAINTTESSTAYHFRCLLQIVSFLLHIQDVIIDIINFQAVAS